MMGRKMCHILMIGLLAVMTTSSASLGESRSMSDRVNTNKSPALNQINNKSPIKKAYTYVSEYKRLPVFNFGIGKRWTDVNGVKGAQPYSFGFGKRSGISTNLYPMRVGLDYLPYDNDNYIVDEGSVDSREQAKRNGRLRQYDFGVGKRSSTLQLTNADMANNRDNYENMESLKKQLNDDMEQMYVYNLRNRLTAGNEVDRQEDD